MTNEIAKEVVALEEAVATLQQEASSERIEAHVTRQMEQFDAKFAGVMAPSTLAALRQEHEDNVRHQHGAGLQARATAIYERHATATLGIANVKAALRRPPAETDPVIDATRQLAAQMRLQGRSRAELFKEYQNTPEGTNKTLTRMLELDLNGFRPADHPEDAQTMLEFAAAIRARQDARVSADIKDAEARAAKLLKPIAVAHLIDHLRSGRGLAPTLRVV
jgi:hypothetical protein